MQNKKNDDILNAILGAAIMATAAERAEAEEDTAEPGEHLERAQMIKDQYDAFLKVGFTEEQATAFVAALLH